MSRISVVIGASFGDEGKGLFTDYLVNQSKSLVVRFNGGGQAGHTVVCPETNVRHVFHQFGAGTFLGAPTFLSNHFILNPITFLTELKELKDKGLDPVVYVDPRAYVTTPYDMMLNQAIEKQRGIERHGSCGLGINETVHRNEHSSFGFKVEDLFDSDIVLDIEEARQVWVPARAKELGLSLHTFEGLATLINNGEIFKQYVSDLMEMISVIKVCYLEEVDWQHDYVFEGAQGLLLDERSSNFPHVTRSMTGRDNVLDILKQAEIQTEPEFYYMSRSYLTRHGAGPLKNELSIPIYPDQTNEDNEHQGKLRFAYLDVQDLIKTVQRDTKRSKANHYFVMSCIDHFSDKIIPHYDDGVLRECHYDVLASYIRMHMGAVDHFTVHGPTRNDVRLP